MVMSIARIPLAADGSLVQPAHDSSAHRSDSLRSIPRRWSRSRFHSGNCSRHRVCICSLPNTSCASSRTPRRGNNLHAIMICLSVSRSSVVVMGRVIMCVGASAAVPFTRLVESSAMAKYVFVTEVILASAVNHHLNRSIGVRNPAAASADVRLLRGLACALRSYLAWAALRGATIVHARGFAFHRRDRNPFPTSRVEEGSNADGFTWNEGAPRPAPLQRVLPLSDAAQSLQT